ncbi:cytosine permease [Acerihabitans sp. TG2]|uniref:cytosine permease n=1 Tax=Acerihabitans sp. TG2 TaxID=3096008 RepID=UPI002B228C23|nr:cytosine permease [Acerihabitans sp. TG2]MEA9393373.1 cytosine permease [Acerihabitans sp. TG2]
MNQPEHYASGRVPPQCRLSLLSIALVHAGMLTALDQFMLGAILGHSMTLLDAFIAITIASLFFGALTFALGFAGMQEGLSGTMLARWSGFGRMGSVLVSLVLTVSLLGWFGVQNAVFAKGINHALGDVPGFALSAAVSGLLLTCLVAFGIKALKITACIAVPLFVAVITFISCQMLSQQNIITAARSVPQGDVLSIPDAITLIMGGCIVAALMTPDITRYAKKSSHVLSMTLFTTLVGEYLINGLAIVLARVLNTEDVVSIMTQTAGGIGLLAVVVSTLRVNDLNLYSSSLGIANTIAVLSGKKVSYTTVTIMLGLTGTGLSLLGILDRLVDFLTLLGIIFPPVVSVMVVGYFTLKQNTHRLPLLRQTQTLPEDKNTPLIGWVAILSCITGTVAGTVSGFGVPAINSLLVAGVVYWSVESAKYHFMLKPENIRE